MSLAIYRKYRPASFEDLLGQELTINILKEAAKQNKMAHAYLFAGPRGTGKTTLSRIVAKIANCEKRQNDKKFREKGEPCNACRICKEIDEGHSMDVMEIDAASNRGIDEIRNLKENIRVSPASSKHKVFIIDEAHQLTKDAANALLKTLEEPPSYAIFILATTEPEKIPATILSRAQQFYFKYPSLEMIVRKLNSIIQKENIAIDPDALELIASSAEGSFRDAESLLDQLVSFGDKTITMGEVEGMVGKVGFDKLSQFAGTLLSQNVKEALSMLSEIEDAGYNLTQFTKDLIQYLRRVMVLKYNPEMEEMFKSELMASHIKVMVDHAKLFTDQHLNLIKNIINAYSQMRYSQFPIIPLEVALVESLK